ncbi:MAG: potassium channel protein [Deltaproteobacteria bacterium]|nr:potassium channel protein [Deltaproteobacteria bacterium]MBW1953800.1 potassium channel protein [Deltaproteobacteria bacterium]MBW1986278.1 potassium channel protein [Deltaproteobacteria bacterium]MBW2135590.1 potassium channel protein [Deltaproteobacteria bacterium]
MEKSALLAEKKVRWYRWLERGHTRLKGLWSDLSKTLSSLIATLIKEKVFFLIGGVVILVFLGALGFALQEADANNFLTRLGHGLWWAVVTLTTVGYGDLVPQSFGGRLVGVGLMLSGLVILSLLTATVASVFIERKFRRERGLENITVNEHIIIMGWHRGGERILKDLLERVDRRTPVVLISEITPQQFEAIQVKFIDHELYFVQGDFSREEILLKTNLRRARRVLILADRTTDRPREQVDQRTLLAALAVKAINPKVRICVELLNPDNRPHLERARVEDIIIRGEYDNALIASATASAGLFKVLKALLSAEGHTFWVVEIPSRFHGHPLQEFADYLRDRHQSLLIALFNEGQVLRLEDLLSGEPSAIDDFIRRKFTEAGMTHLFGRYRTECLINPPLDHILAPDEMAVVIAKVQPLVTKRGGIF